MITLTYSFDRALYILAELPDDGAALTIKWTPKIWATFTFKADGSSTVTTPQIPRFFNAITLTWKQRTYASIIQSGKGKSAFKKLQAHFAARELQRGLRDS
jgi:hypothetical protein